MNAQNLIAGIREKYPEALLASTQPNPFRLFLTVDRENIQDVTDYIFNTAKARLILSAGTDKTRSTTRTKSLSFFAGSRQSHCRTEGSGPSFRSSRPSLTNIIPGATGMKGKCAI